VNVGLFVPCYVDQLAPQVAQATLRLLERVGCRVHYDPDQTCCGQPFLNAGAARAASRLARRHLDRFAGLDAVVTPSASCAATVRRRFPEVMANESEDDARQRRQTFELGEFLVRILERTDLGARFPHRVALLQSCHGLRDLGLGVPSELANQGNQPGPTEQLLHQVEGLEILTPERRDECCGFGGAFSVKFPEISARMGRARLDALSAGGAAFVTGTDVSCLLHLEGLRRCLGRGPQAIHLAEILASEATS
jgi:L-lactate dehydrogenase complex protein LldE